MNMSKSKEIIFQSLRCTKPLPPPLKDIERVEDLKILGVTLTNKLCMSRHIRNILSNNVVSLQRIRNLKCHGADKEILFQVYTALILSRTLYASQAWWGFSKKQVILSLQKFIHRSQRWGYCSPETPELNDLRRKMDQRLFHSVQSDSQHRLVPLLPPEASHRYRTRSRNYSIETADSFSLKNFITRMTVNHNYMQ